MAKVKLTPVLINALHKKPPPNERDTVLERKRAELVRACVIGQARIAPRHGGGPQDAGALLREIDEL